MLLSGLRLNWDLILGLSELLFLQFFLTNMLVKLKERNSQRIAPTLVTILRRSKVAFLIIRISSFIIF